MIRTASVIELVKELNVTDESEDLEAKEVSGSSVGRSVFESICALANEPDLAGGTILLGVSRQQQLFTFYEVSGIIDPDKLSSDIASGCSSMFNQPLRLSITPQNVDGLVVLKIDVPELPKSQKPLYFKARGLPQGAFRRVGPTDVRCTDEDLQAFFQGKSNDPFDGRIVRDALWDDIDPNAVSAYRKERESLHSLAEELNWTDQEMLHSLGAVKKSDGEIRLTATGVLCFGKPAALRRLFPTHRVDYIRVPTNTWFADPAAHFESLDMRGPLMTLIARVIAAISDDLPKTFHIEDGLSGQRTEVPVVPLRVIREAVVNSLMHRSYQTFQPVQVIRYPNRIVIKNPGYSLKSQDRFDEPGSSTRNPTIAEILHDTRFAETKGSGIRVMQAKMKESGLAAPTFESDRDHDEFTTTLLFHHFLDESDWDWLAQFAGLSLSEDQMKALIFVREVGAIDNATYRSLTYCDTLSASRSLRALRSLNLLGDRGSGARTHYVAGPEMLRRAKPAPDAKPPHEPSIQGSEPTLDDIQDSSIQLRELPTPLRVAVRHSHLKKRLGEEEMTSLITRLCGWRALSLQEIAFLLNRNPVYIGQRYITALVASGQLRYLFPEMVQHPGQKYLTVKA